MIQRLLGVERELVSVEGLGVEAEADWDHLYTPETYLGSARSEHVASPDERAGSLRPQSLGTRWRVGDRGEHVVARHGRRQHRLPVPCARRASRDVSRGARGDSIPGAPRRRSSGRVTRRRRRRRREWACSARPASTNSSANTTRSASARWRSPSSSPVPRRTRSRSASRTRPHEEESLCPHTEEHRRRRDRRRRWYDLQPEPRRRTDFMGFNSTWWMAMGWLVLLIVVAFPFPWWW